MNGGVGENYNVGQGKLVRERGNELVAHLDLLSSTNQVEMEYCPPTGNWYRLILPQFPLDADFSQGCCGEMFVKGRTKLFPARVPFPAQSFSFKPREIAWYPVR